MNPASDQYTVTFIVPVRTDIRSIRLEALTHDSLPGQGPGRSTKEGTPAGTFQLTGWDLAAKGPDGADARPVEVPCCVRRLSWNHVSLGLNGTWNNTLGSRTPHFVGGLRSPVTLEAGTELISRMRFPTQSWLSDHNLGRFRLSVSSDPAG